MKKVKVNDKMQRGYTYILSEPMGRNFASGFRPDLSPKEMLKIGVFGGVYMRDCGKEFPKDWFDSAKFAKDKRDAKINYFKINASSSLKTWRENGWIYEEDPRGWFQWYCRYYMGRRLDNGEDERQISRWKAYRRHLTQVKNNCQKGDLKCRPKQRQSLLHWAYDSRKI